MDQTNFPYGNLLPNESVKNNISRYLFASIPLLLAIMLFNGFYIPFIFPPLFSQYSDLALIQVFISISIAWYLYIALGSSSLKIGGLNLNWFSTLLAILGLSMFFLVEATGWDEEGVITDWFALMGFAGFMSLIYSWTIDKVHLGESVLKFSWMQSVALIVIGLMLPFAFGRFDNVLGIFVGIGYLLFLAGLGIFILLFIDWVTNKKK